MIKPVDMFIKQFAKAGADIITFHPENVKNIKKTINLIKSLKKKSWFIIEPECF